MASTIIRSRRDMLKLAGVPAAGALTGLSVLPALAQSGRAIKGHDPAVVPTADTLGRWLRQLHNFGPIRATGTPQCRAFEEFLSTEMGKLGCTVERDQFKLTSWECDIKDCSISVREDSGRTRKLEVIAYFPFGGSTLGKDAVTGKVLFAEAEGEEAGAAILAKYSAAELADSIVVINMPLQGGGIRGQVTFYPGTFPDPLPPISPAPRIASQGGGKPMAALETKCKGLILCYNDVSDEAARYNYLPFSQPHRKIPGVWVGKSGSDYLKSVSGKAVATVRCDARLTPNARADSLMATMKGPSDQVVFMTTHTDGPNEVNDNGGLGLLACATYFSKIRDRRRTFAFSLPTGHYASGAIRDAVTGSGRASGTGGNMAKWPDLVNRSVAQMALEQMGAMEWADENLHWGSTHRPAPEHWIPTPNMQGQIGRMLLASTSGLDPKLSRTGLVISGQAPGEGGSLRTRGIPGIGLMGSPHYFFRCDPRGVIDKLNPQVMHNQIMMATRMLTMMDRLTPEQLKGTAPIADSDIFA